MTALKANPAGQLLEFWVALLYMGSVEPGASDKGGKKLPVTNDTCSSTRDKQRTEQERCADLIGKSHQQRTSWEQLLASASVHTTS